MRSRSELVWLYTGFWAFEIRNELWQLIWIVVTFAYTLRTWWNVRYGVGMAWSYNHERPCLDLSDLGCTDGSRWFTLVAFIVMFYLIALLHTVMFGCATWMRRQEAPPATHNLGPKTAAAAVSAHVAVSQHPPGWR